MNENDILNEYRRGSLSSTNQTVDTPTYEEMDWDAFQQLLISERVEVKRKKIIINREVVISQVLKLVGIDSVIQFKGGSLLFEGMSIDSIFDEECSIQGFQIEVQQMSPCIKVHCRNMMIMACSVENFQNKGTFIQFDNSLIINDTKFNGFQVLFACEGNGTILSINHSIIQSDCQQQQSVLIHANNLREFQIEIINSIIEGSSVIITNSRNVEVRIIDNEFKNQQTSISIENIQNKSIVIEKNVFFRSTDYAIRMNNIVVDRLQLFKNTITKCRIGLFMSNVVEICQLVQLIKPISLKQNVMSSMEQTAIIIREVVCMEIDEINIQDNTIGMDIDISTSKMPDQNAVNPFIITIKNSTISSNRIHGIFLSSNLLFNPINLQISKSAFFSNCNALNLSHQGEPNDKSKPEFIKQDSRSIQIVANSKTIAFATLTKITNFFSPILTLQQLNLII
ncbi:unnamed protein product (macronuclear) [Paramecium tetraurelia]|uniref:Right handed beta helix domain-containing protein n=1 Tax=Paramecium tetraurelia TaxID=5888 RepID=A0CED4_PARTE|nr:uncharacterized protein GSPATT00037588001 [Paramecium tetraurelia]CAK69151.1 unnamed protein product [Paramecium tetraurelia]|eukprot:XP_001436548.1 hypothetical protein (macronuclear) [Paramecium tetraurelia strain d4-2]